MDDPRLIVAFQDRLRNYLENGRDVNGLLEAALAVAIAYDAPTASSPLLDSAYQVLQALWEHQDGFMQTDERESELREALRNLQGLSVLNRV